MQLAVMDPADRDDELVAHTASECTRLCKREVMRIRRHAAAHKAGLPQHELPVVLIAQANRFVGIGEISFLMIRSAQIRAARALLGWRQEDLSKASGVGTATIYRIEKSDSSVIGYASTFVRIQAALEQAGIQFIENDAIGGFGLRFKDFKEKNRQ